MIDAQNGDQAPLVVDLVDDPVGGAKSGPQPGKLALKPAGDPAPALGKGPTMNSKNAVAAREAVERANNRLI